MSIRLQVLIPEALDAKLRKAAQRRSQSKGEWVRVALERALAEDRGADPLDRLARLEAPTGDIDSMLAEDRGRPPMTRVFVDSNIPMYVAGKEHPNREPALRFLARARAGEFEACTSTEVLQEILHRYVGLGRLDLARGVYDLFAQLCPVIYPVTLADTDRAKDMACAGLQVSVRDAVHAAVMLNHEVVVIATFDAAFDGIAGVQRFTFD